MLIVLGADPNNTDQHTLLADAGWPAVITNVTNTTTDHTLVVLALLREDGRTPGRRRTTRPARRS